MHASLTTMHPRPRAVPVSVCAPCTANNLQSPSCALSTPEHVVIFALSADPHAHTKPWVGSVRASRGPHMTHPLHIYMASSTVDIGKQPSHHVPVPTYSLIAAATDLPCNLTDDYTNVRARRQARQTWRPWTLREPLISCGLHLRTRPSPTPETAVCSACARRSAVRMHP